LWITFLKSKNTALKKLIFPLPKFVGFHFFFDFSYRQNFSKTSINRSVVADQFHWMSLKKNISSLKGKWLR